MNNNWTRELTELELKAFCNFVLDENNNCERLDHKEYPEYLGEGLTQTLYKFPNTNEYVLIIRQKGYIVNALHIKSNEFEDFQKNWETGKLFPYGKLKDINSDKERDSESKITPATALESALEGTSKTKADEANGVEKIELNSEKIKKGETKDD